MSTEQHGSPQDQPENAATGTHGLAMAIWRDCEDCRGRGWMLVGFRQKGDVCTLCKGCGKQPTFIPLDDLNEQAAIPHVIICIRQWMRAHDAAVNELAADLDASGLVPEMPPKVSGIEDRVRAVPLEPDVPASAMPALDGIFYGPEDLTKAKASLTEGAWPEHQAKVIPPQVKPVPDLPAAAKKLVDAVEFLSFTQALSVEMDAAKMALVAALDASPTQPSPDAQPQPMIQAAQAKARASVYSKVMWALRTELLGNSLTVAIARLQGWLQEQMDWHGAQLHKSQPEGQKTCLTCMGNGTRPITGMPADRLPGGWFTCNDCNGSGVQPDKEGKSDD